MAHALPWTRPHERGRSHGAGHRAGRDLLGTHGPTWAAQGRADVAGKSDPLPLAVAMATQPPDGMEGRRYGISLSAQGRGPLQVGGGFRRASPRVGAILLRTNLGRAKARRDFDFLRAGDRCSLREGGPDPDHYDTSLAVSHASATAPLIRGPLRRLETGGNTGRNLRASKAGRIRRPAARRRSPVLADGLPFAAPGRCGRREQNLKKTSRLSPVSPRPRKRPVCPRFPRFPGFLPGFLLVCPRFPSGFLPTATRFPISSFCYWPTEHRSGRRLASILRRAAGGARVGQMRRARFAIRPLRAPGYSTYRTPFSLLTRTSVG